MTAAHGGTPQDTVSAEPAFGERYLRAFLTYLDSGDEAQLAPAYEIGRAAVGDHLSLLELAEAHRLALEQGVHGEPDPSRRALRAARAAAFLRESLAAFEIAHGGYLEVQEIARIEHEHARQLQTVAEVSVALNAALPVEDVLELVTAEARNVLRGDVARAHVELPGTQGGRRVTASSGESPAVAPPRADGIASGDAPARADAPPSADGAAPAPGDENGHEHPRRWLRAEIVGRGGLAIGALEVLGADEDDAGAEAILIQLAQVASAAIASAQLHALEREIAETLQRSLLPQRLPRIPGLDIEARYCAAGDGIVVGGDFYDVFPTNDTAWGLAIGDVCGKGPHAAALTALVRYTLRAAALWERRPERVMAMVNAAILDQRSDHRFCTALYGQLQLEPGGGARVDFVTCGHPLPIVVRAGGAVETVGAFSTVLGVVTDPAIHADTILLAPGDLLLVHTDGVTEVRRNGRAVFGEQQLLALLGSLGDVTADKAVERVEDAVLNASGGAPRDDLAVLAIRIPA